MNSRHYRRKIFTVGLTGGVASGKSTVSALFAERGITIVDTDTLARECVAPGSEALHKIIAHFGTKVLNDDGTLNRGTLRTIIFSDPKEKKWLEDCLHPLIRSLTKQRVETSRSPYTIVAIPLLAEHYADYPWLDTIVLVDCSVEQQLTRLMERDGISQEHAQAMLAAQSTPAQRRAIADHVISNDRSNADLIDQVEALHALFLQQAACD